MATMLQSRTHLRVQAAFSGCARAVPLRSVLVGSRQQPQRAGLQQQMLVPAPARLIGLGEITGRYQIHRACMQHVHKGRTAMYCCRCPDGSALVAPAGMSGTVAPISSRQTVSSSGTCASLCYNMQPSYSSHASTLWEHGSTVHGYQLPFLLEQGRRIWFARTSMPALASCCTHFSRVPVGCAFMQLTADHHALLPGCGCP